MARKRSSEKGIPIPVIIGGIFCPLVFVVYFLWRYRGDFAEAAPIVLENLPDIPSTPSRPTAAPTPTPFPEEPTHKHFTFIDATGMCCESGSGFRDWAGLYVPWGESFIDHQGFRREWGGPFYDNRDFYRHWGEPFYDAGDNYVVP